MHNAFAVVPLPFPGPHYSPFRSWHVQLMESFHDELGVSRLRVVATLGQLESVQAGGIDALVNGLLRAAGKPTLDEGTGEAALTSGLSVGDTL
jgi:hypothetical protein